MTTATYLSVLKKRKVVLAVFVLVFFVFAMAISFSQSLKYRASSRLVIIQQNTSADPYAIAKSNQYIGNLLAQTVSSGSFFEMISSSVGSIDWSYFSGSYKEQMKLWRKTVVAKNINDTGLLIVEVYHPEPEQARQLSIAVNNLLIQKNGLYPDNKNISVRIIDQPTLSSWPVKPNILTNGVAAIVFGLIAGLIYVYYRPTERSVKLKRQPATERGEQIAHKISVPLPPRQLGFMKNLSGGKPTAAYDFYNETSNSDFRGNIQNVIKE